MSIEKQNIYENPKNELLIKVTEEVKYDIINNPELELLAKQLSEYKISEKNILISSINLDKVINKDETKQKLGGLNERLIA